MNQTFGGGLALALLRTFTARGIAALGALMLVLVVGLNYGPEGVGVLALAQGLLMGAGILSKCGMDSALMRFVGQDPTSPNVLGYLWWAIKKAALIAFFSSLVLFFSRSVLEQLFSSPGLSSMLLGFSLALPAYVFGFLLSGFFKGVRMSATACLMENGGIALYAAGILWCWEELAKVNLNGMLVVGFAYLAASLIVVLQGLFQLRLWLKNQSWYNSIDSDTLAGVVISNKELSETSKAFFVTTFAVFMQNVLSIMLAGWLLSNAELGLFKSSQQVGMLIAFILLVINAIFPPRFAAMYYKGDIPGLSRLARQGTLVGVFISLPFLLLCLIFPEWVMHWFGKGFSKASTLLQIIALAQFVNVATGSVGLLLNMTGHEKLMRNIALVSNFLGLLVFLILIPLFGPMGAAIGLAFILVVQNLVALFYVWRVLGIWTLPCPNLLVFLGVNTLAAPRKG